MLSAEQLHELRQSRFSPNRLKEAMRLAGVTQVQLAAAMGLSQPVISDDANGKFVEMDLAKSRAYAIFFGCTVDDLFPPSRQRVSA